MKTLVISDIDGVVANAVGGLCDYLWRTLGLLIGENDITDYDCETCITNLWHHYDVTALRSTLYKECWHNPLLMQRLSSYESLNRAYTYICLDTPYSDLVFITSRANTKEMRHATHVWISDHNMFPGGGCIATPSCGVAFAGSTPNKIQRLLDILKLNTAYNHFYYIEDRADVVFAYLQAAKEHNKCTTLLNKHTTLLVPARPWNTDVPDEYRMSEEKIARILIAAC